MRFARSRRLTDRTKPSDSAVRYGSACGGCGSTAASTPLKRRSLSATFCDVANTRLASPSDTASSRSIARRVARSSGDSENCPSSVRS